MYSFLRARQHARPDHPAARAGRRSPRSSCRARPSASSPPPRPCSRSPRRQLRAVSASIAGEVGSSRTARGRSRARHASRSPRRDRAGGRRRATQSHRPRCADRQAARDCGAQGGPAAAAVATNIATQRLVAPGILVMDSKIAEWRRANAGPGLDERGSRRRHRQLGQEIATFLPHQRAQIELSAINDGLLKTADAPDTGGPAAARLPAAAARCSRSRPWPASSTRSCGRA